MSTHTAFPLELYKANLDLQLRIAGLFQESARKWFELGKCAIDDGIVEAAAETEQLFKTRDWRTLTTLSGEAFLHQLLLGIGDTKGAAGVAMEAQTAFVAGLQDAIQTWRRDAARIVAGIDIPLSPAWTDLLKQWSQYAPSIPATPPAAKKRTRGAVRGH